jgi:hypothetical protein
MDPVRMEMLKNLGISSLLVTLGFICVYLAITGCTAWIRQAFRGYAAPVADTIYRPQRRDDGIRTRGGGNTRRRRDSLDDDGDFGNDNDPDDAYFE